MSFDPTGGAISGADDVALSNPQTDEILTYNGSVEKWQNNDAGYVTQSDIDAHAGVTANIHGIDNTQTRLRRLLYDSGASSYPPRPDDDVPTEFIGPTEPSDPNMRLYDTWVEITV